MNCSACGVEVSAAASTCGSCGAAIEKPAVPDRIEITMASLGEEPIAPAVVPQIVSPAPRPPMSKPAAMPMSTNPRPLPPFPQQQAGGYAVPVGYFVQQQNSGAGLGLAIASLVLGVLWLYWLGSILAVIFGHVALSQAKRSGDTGGGAKGMAIAGLVLGWIGVATLLFFIIALASAGSSTG